MELEKSIFLTSDSTTNLHSSRQKYRNIFPYIENKKYRPMEQVESPEINPCTYGHLILDKGGKTIQWRNSVSSISGARKPGQIHVKE